MTIAACYLSPEGVVLGADSTTTYGNKHYNNSQKVFEIGEDSTIGVVTWGLGGLVVRSHRTLFAELSDDLRAKPPADMQDVATRWAAQFWQAYSDPTSPIAAVIADCKALAVRPAYDAAAQPAPAGMRSEKDEEQFTDLLLGLSAGFCIAGYLPGKRVPEAYEIQVGPLDSQGPTPKSYPPGYWFWGAPKIFQRLILGCDADLQTAILSSGHWTGTPQDLNALVSNQVLSHPIVPIRDAIDFIHACISSTIKAFKFSGLAPICGGPIELAVITTDRNFRWVRHKRWDTAITEGEPDARERSPGYARHANW